jgi:carbon storage regulator
MLVVSRKVGESVVIDGRIAVTVVGCGRGRARIGVTAPPTVGVSRPEAKGESRRAGPTTRGCPAAR